MREQFYILKTEIVAERGRSAQTARCKKLFRQSSGSKMRIDFRDAFPADLLLRHLQHAGTIAGFRLIAVDDEILVYLGTVIMECVLCTV